MIIGLTGEKLAGKGMFSEYMVEKYKAKTLRFSQILDDILDRLYLPKSRNNEIALVLALREKFGKDVLAYVIKKDIEKSTDELLVLDGVRYPEEANILKMLPKFFMVYITASLELRYERALVRKQKDDEKNISFEEFKQQEEAPTEVLIGLLGQHADYKIENAGDLPSFHKQIDAFYKEFSWR